MSKTALLNIKNVNLFNADKTRTPVIEFTVKKDTKVPADYSVYDKDKGYDVRGIKVPKNGDKKAYIRLTITTTENGKREYHNGALFTAEKKSDNQPDMTGSLNLTNDPNGEKLRLSAWVKEGTNSGKYLSIAISEFTPKSDAAKAPAVPSEDEAAKAKAAAADMDDDIPF